MGDFFIVNLTRRTRMDWTGNTWPHVSTFGEFAEANDTLELVEIRTNRESYKGIKYIKQSPYTYGMERINPDKSGYVLSKQRATDWLEEQKKIEPERAELPLPRCKVCLETYEDIPEVQCIRDCGKCLECKAKESRRDVVLPRPKKKSS